MQANLIMKSKETFYPMSREIAEKDWRHLRDMKPRLVDRYCEQILRDIEEELSRPRKENAHEIYLKIYRLIEKQDKVLGEEFSDFKRSNALIKILGLYNLGMFMDEELNGFSDETIAYIELFFEKG
jgi:hypothetical protein